MQNRTGQAAQHWLDRAEAKIDRIIEDRQRAVFDRLEKVLPREIYPPPRPGDEPFTGRQLAQLFACLLELEPAERKLLKCTEANVKGEHWGLDPAGLDAFGGREGEKFFRWAEGRGFEFPERLAWHQGYLSPVESGTNGDE